MAKQVSKTVIGGFVISSIALLIIGVLVFGGGRFFTKTIKFALFFDGSVKGLNVGSAVVFRGVKIGIVENVFIQADAEKLAVDIPVIVELEPEQFRVSGKRLPKDPYEKAKRLIARGLRCQLATESFVTGQLMVAMDFDPDKPVRLTGIDVGYPELPTIHSDLEQLAEKMKEIPVEDLFKKIQATMTNLDKLVGAPELMDIIRNVKTATAKLDTLLVNADKFMVHVDQQVNPVSTGLQASMGDIRQLVKNVDSQVNRLSPKAQDAMVSAKGTLDEATQTLQAYKGLVDKKSDLRIDMAIAFQEIARAARYFQAFFDYIEQHPEALLQGKGPGGGE